MNKILILSRQCGKTALLTALIAQMMTPASACDINKATQAPIQVQVLPRTTLVIPFDYSDCTDEIALTSFYVNIASGKKGFSANLLDETTGQFIQSVTMKNTGVVFHPGYNLKGHVLKLTLEVNGKNAVWVSVLRN